MKTKLTFAFLFFTFRLFAQSPGGISGNLRAWYKADAGITATGGNISAWNNQVSGGVHITNVSGTPVSTAVGLNFNPTVTFNGTSYMASHVVAGSNFLHAADNSFFIVFTHQMQATGGVMCKWENTTSNRMSWETASAGRMRLDYPKAGTVGNAAVNGTKLSTTAVNSLSHIATGLTNGSVDTLAIDGVPERSQTSSASDPVQTGRLQLGANWSGGVFPYTGDIAEIIFYNTHLSAINRIQVESYLALKYGITLGNTTAPISYLASNSAIVPWTANGVYQNNVAGIGRDDNSGLLQKQSKSVNPNSPVSIGLNAIATSNATNTGNFTANTSFLVWGDNNQPMSANGVTDVPAGIQQRVAKTWLSRETGTVAAVRVKFDLSGTGLAAYGIDYQYLRLLVDDDGIFATGATVISPVAYNNGSNTVEFDVDFTAATGFYFSLGTVSTMDAPLPLDFLSFELRAQQEQLLLEWSTANEKNVKHFVIEQSADANSWTEQAIVSASNTAGVHHYTHTLGSSAAGLHYYRIREVDFDGSYMYSPIRSIYKTRASTLSVAPVPAGEYLNVFSEAETEFTITDFTGHTVYKDQLSARENKQINVSTWSEGFYFIHYFIEHAGTDTQKLMILHGQ